MEAIAPEAIAAFEQYAAALGVTMPPAEPNDMSTFWWRQCHVLSESNGTLIACYEALSNRCSELTSENNLLRSIQRGAPERKIDPVIKGKYLVSPGKPQNKLDDKRAQVFSLSTPNKAS
jgi:hypothetical protein